MSVDRAELVEGLLAGDVRALARAISVVEGEGQGADTLLERIYPRTGRALVVGVTGAPGSGKSSLVDRLVQHSRAEGRRVGVVAVDPSSAYSGGAILGDRVRMQRHASDPQVFIRSMATRGHLGGLARATNDVLDLLDGAGYDPLLVETVGVGQDEIDVVRTADVVVVVLVPGMGDDIQALKAGILEIADVFAINKSDRPGADRLEADLAAMLSLGSADARPRPAIVHTVAVEDRGIAELAQAIAAVVGSADPARRAARRRDRAEARFLGLVGERILSRVRDSVLAGAAYDTLLTDLAERRVDPYTAAREVLERLEVR